MEYIKLILGFAFLVAFSWILVKNIERKGLLHSILRIDTIAGIVAGLYLVFTSAISLFY